MAELRPPVVDPRLNEFIVTPDQVTRALFLIMQRVLVNPDLAYREDHVLQRQMRNDPDVESALDQRILAVAEQKWNIVPDVEGDAQAQAQARAIERAIKRMRNLTQFIRQLSLGIWYGHSGANVKYAKAPKAIEATGGEDDEETAEATYIPDAWLPIHPDSIAFDIEGRPLLKVNPTRWRGPRDQLGFVEDGYAISLTPAQRACTVVHVWNIEGADYTEDRATAMPYSGRGLRTTLWWTWLLKQSFLKFAARFAEKLGGGIILGRFPAGNDGAKEAMGEVLKNLAEDVSVLLPVGGATEKDQYGIDVLEPKGTGCEIFWKILNDYFGDRIRRQIVGQTLTMEAGPTGLGSEVSKTHERSFARLVNYDGCALAETLTSEFVRPLARLNFPESEYEFRWEFSTDQVDPKDYLEAVDKFVGMGGTVSEAVVRGKIGMARPKDGERIIGPATTMAGQVPGDGLDDLFGGLPGGGDPRRNGQAAEFTNGAAKAIAHASRVLRG